MEKLNKRVKSGAGVAQSRQAWHSMRARCRNLDDKYYGGRGIRVCERWQSFENFLADMGECPPNRSLDRIDNNGNYEPGNCRWATREQQSQNRRKPKPGYTRPSAPTPSKDHLELINALGGPTVVAEMMKKRLNIRLKPQAVSNWARRGIPFRYRAPLAIEAREHDVGVPANFLGEGGA